MDTRLGVKRMQARKSVLMPNQILALTAPNQILPETPPQPVRFVLGALKILRWSDRLEKYRVAAYGNLWVDYVRDRSNSEVTWAMGACPMAKTTRSVTSRRHL